MADNKLAPILLLFSLLAVAPGSRHSGLLRENHLNVTPSELFPKSNASSTLQPVQTGGSICGDTIPVTSESSRKTTCPDECPLFSKNKADDEHCTYTCVPASTEQCKAHNPNAPVVDLEMGICRACMVEGCAQCSNDGSDTCAECNSGFRLHNGKCSNKYETAWYILFGVVGILALLIIGWVVDLARRPLSNQKGLDQGLALRSRAKLHMPAEEEGGHQRQRLWPLTTNLCKSEVAGPGVLLQFNFQVALIIWALVLAIGWALLGGLVDTDLFILGTRRAKTPRQNCVIVAWGYETQHALMWTKVLFCICAYIFSFIGSLCLALRQLSIYEKQDEDNTTHKDFTAELGGLPQISGAEHVEEELAAHLEAATGQKIIGVCVCWDMLDKEEELMHVLENEVDEREAKLQAETSGAAQQDVPAKSEPNGLSKIFAQMEKGFLSPTTQKIITKGRRKAFPKRHYKHIAAGEKAPVQVDIDKELRELKSTEKAYIVFENEESRDKAVAAVSDGLNYKGQVISLKEAQCEPESVNWRNMHNDDPEGTLKKVIMAIGVIFFALFVWTVAFYLPYAYFAMSFNYAYGMEPGAVESLTFSMVVCLGNVLMYLVCAEVSDRIGFHYTDDRETCYLLLYTFACIFNVVLDLVCSYFIAYYMMVGMGMKTYHGVRLSEVHTFTERFETYAMQRELGTVLMEYSFPATFLIPFLIEPLATIYLPYRIMTYIVRVHPELTGSSAEAYLGGTPMDLSRYADIQLNVMLASLIVFFPGGFNMKMFLGLVGSHIYIYLFDHWRVLRSIPTCWFALKKVDWWAQWLLSIPCGVILSGLVFKSNCHDFEGHSFLANFQHCDSGFSLVSKVAGAFFLHVVVHTIILIWVIPRFEHQRPAGTNHYSECAKRLPGSWFAMNPVHCLRSQFVYGHNPPCDYRMLGKEHLIRKNEKIGMYFASDMADTEQYEYNTADLKDFARNASRSLKSAVSGVEETPAASAPEPEATEPEAASGAKKSWWGKK